MSKSDRNMQNLLVAGLVGAGALAGIAIGYMVASANFSFPFPRGADKDYLCVCEIGTSGRAPGDFVTSIPPGRSCPHRNPCNNVNCDYHEERCREKLGM